MAVSATSPKVEKIEAGAYRIPTDRHESDGTIEWDSTTVVIVCARGGGKRGIGYSYTSAGALAVISGGFTSYSIGELAGQLSAWAAEGFPQSVFTAAARHSVRAIWNIFMITHGSRQCFLRGLFDR